jgi:uncharacterized protein YyaL (SSP411 family)
MPEARARRQPRQELRASNPSVLCWLPALLLVLTLGFARPGVAGEALPGAPPMSAALKAKLATALAARGPDYVPRTRNKSAEGAPLYTNRLILETSPYLGQHAHNPVNWYSWGDEAFEAAKRLNRPVLVSIGYSTCHWCHVMEEESFDDPDVAEILNANFIAIKVDRESRPDVDAIYMSAIHALGQRGGWPLNVWVTPDKKPFYAGTYFPPRSSRGRPSFTTALNAISDRWKQEPAALEQIGAQLEEAVSRSLASDAPTSTREIDANVLERAYRTTVGRIDRTWGGIGERTKFPSSTPLRFLLRYHRRTGDAAALRLAILTLEKMASGGIYDQAGGGFHRYSTDRRWLVPHFEKMLYDNALMVPAYLEASQITGWNDLGMIARDIVDYVLREMTSPEGGFYSATDADSANPEGEFEEGWYFTWTTSELETVLGKRRGQIVSTWYGATAGGNFEGRNILHVSRPYAEVASELGLTEAELRKEVADARPLLLEARSQRPAPLRDEKVLVAWNGLIISAAAQAGFVLNDDRYIAAARRAADFILRELRREGRLHRVYMNGRADGPAFLEDYAFLIAGLLDLYEADPEPRWLSEAIELQSTLDRHYADGQGGGYFKTANDGEKLLAREKPGRDGAEPAGNSVAALNLLRLSEFTLDSQYRDRALSILSAAHDTLERDPMSLSVMLLAVDFLLDVPFEIVIVAPADRAGETAMLAPLRTSFVPNRILSVVEQGDEQAAHLPLVPIVGGKRALKDRTTAYVCVNRVCSFPTSDPERFAKQIVVVEPFKSPSNAWQPPTPD